MTLPPHSPVPAQRTQPPQSAPPSWDSARESTPERPPVTAGFSAVELIERPKRTVWVFALVLLAALVTVAITVSAAMRIDDLREVLTGIIPADLSEEYDEDTIQRAITIFLGAVGGLGFALALVQVLSAVQLLRRKTGARVVLAIFVLLSLPVAFVAVSLREAGTADLVATSLSLVALSVAVVLALTPRVSTWLRQDETPGKQKLLTQSER